MITQERLKELFNYDPKTGSLTRLISPSNCVQVGDIAGSDKGSGYLQIKIGGRSYMAHRLAWLYVHGKWPLDQIDHINHARGDNRIANLREVSHAENQKNTSMIKNNTSGIMGVRWNKSVNKWRACIKSDGRQIHLGYFDNFSDACCARKSAELKHGFHENHGA